MAVEQVAAASTALRKRHGAAQYGNARFILLARRLDINREAEIVIVISGSKKQCHGRTIHKWCFSPVAAWATSY